MTTETIINVKDKIRAVNDFPKPGIIFRDITTALKEPETLKAMINYLCEQFKDIKIDYIAGIESRGFIFGMPMAYKQELETGPAQILCCVDGQVSAYDAEIVKIDLNHEDTNKSFVIQVTDPELLELTGGIVQGMSGSPVIQNGKFVFLKKQVDETE